MKSLSENRRAKFDYEILEKLEVGIELLGHEVKSAKTGKFEITGAYALIRKNEAWLLNGKIPPYQPNNIPESYDPERTRRLLLNQKEIKNLQGRLQEKGLSLIPLRAYLKKNLVKIELGLGRARKKEDKREYLKKKTARKEIQDRE